MAKQFKPVGSVSVAVPGELKMVLLLRCPSVRYLGPSGRRARPTYRGSLHVGSEGKVTFSMAAADALQLAEELRAAVHRRDDVRRG